MRTKSLRQPQHCLKAAIISSLLLLLRILLSLSILHVSSKEGPCSRRGRLRATQGPSMAVVKPLPVVSLVTLVRVPVPGPRGTEGAESTPLLEALPEEALKAAEQVEEEEEE